MFMEKWVKRLKKKSEWYDFSLIKLSTFLFALFFISAWPAFYSFVMKINWTVWLGLAIVVAIPPFMKIIKD